MRPEMLRTALVEDLNALACPEAQERLADQPARVREALDRLRFIDTTELGRYRGEGWLDTREVDRIEQFLMIARDRLSPIPAGSDPVEFTRADPGWSVVRQHALELVVALDAFVDVGVAGWGQQYKGGNA